VKAPGVTGPRDVLLLIIAIRQRIEQVRDEARAAADVSGFGQALDEVREMILAFERRVRQSAVEVLLVECPPGVAAVDLELNRLCATPGLPERQLVLATELIMERASTEALRIIAANEKLFAWTREMAALTIERRVCAVPN